MVVASCLLYLLFVFDVVATDSIRGCWLCGAFGFCLLVVLLSFVNSGLM